MTTFIDALQPYLLAAAVLLIVNLQVRVSALEDKLKEKQ